MERHKPISGNKSRRIILTRSEPLVNLKKLREVSGFNSTLTSLQKRTNLPPSNRIRDIQAYACSKTVHPPVSTRSKLTVVSPKRRIRLSQHSAEYILRSNADGESACSTDEEKSISKLKLRLPGDGCNSDSEPDNNDDGDDDRESEKSFTDLDSTAGGDGETVEDESYFDDMTYEDNLTDNDEYETSSSSNDSITQNMSDLDEEPCLSSLNSEPSLRLKFSKCSLEEESPLPLLKSLFSNKPPTLYFTTADEKVCQLPFEVRKLLKWKSSTVTPKVIKSCIARTGFRITKKNTDWLGVWGKHMKPVGFKGINIYQKINHFPGTFHIGRKDKLWRNFCKMKITYGKQDFNFVPQTYVLPHDLAQLKKVWVEGTTKNKWIIKPPASARGTGIKVIHKWSQLPKKRPVVVQRYLSKPYLINGHKFDLRIYVYVTSFDPLRIYIFEDGLVRFATTKYSTSSKSLSNKYIHLTNYSINKNNKEVYTSHNENLDDSKKSYKWSLKELWKYFQSEGINPNKIWEAIKDIAVKAVLCGDSNINTLIKQNITNRLSCHELFGLDIILDSKLKPWLLEVNISPSLHSNSDLDRRIKGQLVKDILNMAGFFLPRYLLLSNSGRCPNIDEIAADKFWFEPRQLSSDERAKHTFYIKRHDDLRARCTILDVLTPDDVLMIMEAEDEFSRCGSFERLIPTVNQKCYLRFMQTPRYYNLLLEEWTKQYMRDAFRSGLGISLVQSLADSGIHLSDGVSIHPRHQWTQRTQQQGSRPQISRQMLSASQLPSLNRRKSQGQQLTSRKISIKKKTTNKKMIQFQTVDPVSNEASCFPNCGFSVYLDDDG